MSVSTRTVIVGVAAITLVIGVAIGSIAFPPTKTDPATVRATMSTITETQVLPYCLTALCTTSTCFALPQNATQPVNGTECGAPPNIFPLNATLTQIADNMTTEVVANLGGASAIRFEISPGFGLCASNCGYPSPYMSGGILFFSNSTTAVSPVTLQYFVNGTGSSVQTLSKPSDVPNGQNWGMTWKSGANGVSIISGKPYLITFVISYADGTTQSESVVLIAD
jgi:hypothetical protein